MKCLTDRECLEWLETHQIDGASAEGWPEVVGDYEVFFAAPRDARAEGNLARDMIACAQIMHIGPFSEENPSIEKVHLFITSKGQKKTGKHHEIYLSGIRKADPAKWKTAIRQPMQ